MICQKIKMEIFSNHVGGTRSLADEHGGEEKSGGV